MDLTGLGLAGALALAIGVICGRRLPVAGLALVLAAILGIGLSRWAFGWDFPTLTEAMILMALVQLGYVASAFVTHRRSADRAPLRQSHHQDRHPS